jgi:chromosome segregation ATPase
MTEITNVEKLQNTLLETAANIEQGNATELVGGVQQLLRDACVLIDQLNNNSKVYLRNHEEFQSKISALQSRISTLKEMNNGASVEHDRLKERVRVLDEACERYGRMVDHFLDNE